MAITIISIIVGVIVGSTLRGELGFLLGGVVGYLFGRTLMLGSKIQRLENILLRLDSKAEWQAAEVEEPDIEKPIQQAEPELPQVSEKLEPEQISVDPVNEQPSISLDAKEHEPDIADKIINYIKYYFTEGNVPVRIGIVILFLGAAFLLQYVHDRIEFRVEYTLIAVALGGLALLIIGWRLREKQRLYALVMQGGAVAILYLTVFSAFKLYQLLPFVFVFPFLIVMAVLSAGLAVFQNSKALAVLGISGGFLAPVLTSTGQGNHIALFSYYAILNLGILFVAWHKSWRLLNLIGFAFTFVIGTVWGVVRYQPDLFYSSEFFLILFFLFYVVLSVLFAYRQPPQLKGYVDGSIVFGTPLICFALQSGLVASYEYGMAWSAFSLGIFYLLLTKVLINSFDKKFKLLCEAYLALGVVFASLAIPMAFDGNLTAAFWSLEGSAILWIAIRQHRMLAKMFALILQIGAGLVFLFENNSAVHAWPVLNGPFLGAVLIAIAGIFSSYQLYRSHQQSKSGWELMSSYLLLAWGLIWWFVNGLDEADRYLINSYELLGFVLFTSFSFLALYFVYKRLSWQVLSYAPIGFLAFLSIFVILSFGRLSHPTDDLGYLFWPISISIYFWVLKNLESDIQDKNFFPLLHAAGLWLLVILLTWELYWQVDHWVGERGVWRLVALLVIALITLTLISRRAFWPFNRETLGYQSLAAVPLLIFLSLWSIVVNQFSNGDPWPSVYIPFVNPLDIVQIIVLIVLAQWWLSIRDLSFFEKLDKTVVYSGFALFIFYWLNTILLRTLHHWLNIPYKVSEMFQSYFVQASLSIFWTLLGLIIMVYASRKSYRVIWMTGAGLLGAVVGKLFIVDLSGKDSIERIVSFLVVGILLLVIGYYSPIPPSTKEAIDEKN